MDIVKQHISEFVVKSNGTLELLSGPATPTNRSVVVSYPSQLVGKKLQAVLLNWDIEKNLVNDGGELIDLSFEITNGARIGNFVKQNFIWLPVAETIPTSSLWRFGFTTSAVDDRFINYSAYFFYSDQPRTLIPEM
jgi:hypothetical protein